MSFFANLIEGGLSLVAPGYALQWKLNRLALREAERFVGHREAWPTRLDRPVTARGTSGDYELELGLDRRGIADRAQNLDANNVLAGALLDCSTSSVLGDGFKLRAKTKSPEWNKRREELWADWCKRQADVRGLDTFDELLETIYRSWLRDGDVAVVLNADRSIRIVESAEIASPEGGYYRPNMADGVELDPHGRPLAYWIFNPDPNVLYADRRAAMHRLVRVEAKHVLFLRRYFRASATRGLSIFNGMIGLLQQLDGTIEAVTVAHRMAALFSLVIKKKAPFSGAQWRQDSNGTMRPQLNFEPGSVMRLEPDEDVQQITPAHPGAQSAQHMRDLGRVASSRFVFPFEFVILDLTIGNYSNYRTGLTLVKKARQNKQKKIARIASSLYEWDTIRCMEEGLLPVRADALSHSWTKPGTPWLDPVAEFQAAQGAIDAGMDTLTNQANERGMELEDLAVEREGEIKLFAKKKIPIVRSTLTRDPVVVEDEDEDDSEDGGEKPQDDEDEGDEDGED